MLIIDWSPSGKFWLPI